MKFRIRTVAERTGVAETTLRAWERRYGFPRPQRSESGYRLYGPEEVEAVRRVVTLTAQGLSVSEAIALVRQQPTPNPTELDALIAQFWQAAQALDEDALSRVVAHARNTLAPLRFCDDFCLPLLRVMAARLDVARQHLASAVLHQHMRMVAEANWERRKDKRIVLACPAGEQHEGGLLAIGIALSALGWRVLTLGANTPPEALAEAARTAKPKGLCMSFVQPKSAVALRRAIKEVTSLVRVPVIVGGPAARAHLKEVFAAGATYAETADEVVELLSRKA